MRLLPLYPVLAWLGRAAAYGSDEKTSRPLRPCTVRSPITGSFFDLNPVWLKPPAEELAEDEDPPTSWHAQGYDYGSNFTLNICGPVVEDISKYVDVDPKESGKVGAFYVRNNQHYSIGFNNSELVMRGRKLVLNYTGGSYCDEEPDPHRARRAALPDLYADYNYDPYDTSSDGDEVSVDGVRTTENRRRKSTVISLLCNRDTLTPSVISLVGWSPDYCTYNFEMRTSAACSIVEAEEQTLGPTGVFGMILLIAFAVYVVGGCVYQRTVMHQRGWHQMPNYSMWAGMVNFVVDLIVIVTSSCMSLLPGRRGYSRVSTFNNGNSRGALAEDENRLIDELNEEWED